MKIQEQQAALMAKFDAVLAKMDALLRALESREPGGQVDLREFFMPLAARDTSAGTGLAVTLDTGEYGGRLQVEVWVRSSGPAEFQVSGSRDGVEYRVVDTISLGAAGEAHKGYFNAYRYVKVSTAARNNNEIEIVASR